MEQGGFALHLRRMRRLYAERQRLLIDALAPLSHILDIAPDPAGMHLVCPLKPACPMDDRTIATRAREAGLGLRALSAYFETADAPQGLVMGYAGFDAETLRNAAETLRRILTK
jgi:GntR family transcriptional regulator/MocR family aminotransferase